MNDSFNATLRTTVHLLILPFTVQQVPTSNGRINLLKKIQIKQNKLKESLITWDWESQNIKLV